MIRYSTLQLSSSSKSSSKAGDFFTPSFSALLRNNSGTLDKYKHELINIPTDQVWLMKTRGEEVETDKWREKKKKKILGVCGSEGTGRGSGNEEHRL